MAYVKLKNGNVGVYPYSIGQLRKDNPNTSFPRSIPDSVLESYGVYPVVTLAEPQYDMLKESALISGTPVLSDGVWVVGWDITPLPVEQVGVNMRLQRDELLVASDWTQVADAPVDQATWATYRQALRDIPQQAGFPTDVIWPEQPK